MRNFLWSIPFGLVVLLLFSSCGDSRTYAKQIAEEKALIERFIKRNGIKVVEKLPADSVFLNDKKLYYKSASGMYYRLEKASERPDTIALGDRLTIDARYLEYTLEAKSDTADYLSPNNYPYGLSFVYGGSTVSTATAFLEAVGYMKKSEAEAKLIVPHKLGFDATGVTPYGYDLKIKFRRDTIPQ